MRERFLYDISILNWWTERSSVAMQLVLFVFLCWTL